MIKGRRRTLKTLGAWLGAAALDSGFVRAAEKTAESLVPSRLSSAPNYWCTWAAQNYLYGQNAKEIDLAKLEGSDGAEFARDLLNEEVIIGRRGWSETCHVRAREELYLLLDDGWEEDGSASFQLDRKKFSSFSGSAQERLRGLNEAVRAQGWRSLALWCRDTPKGKEAEERVRWMQGANVPYLKIDVGDETGSLTRARTAQRAALTLEHVHGESCLSGSWKEDGRFGAQPWGSSRIEILKRTDVYRTYDTTATLGVPTTLDRATELLLGASGHAEVKALLNVEDEVYIAAVLGCTMGVMRHPFRGLRPGNDADVFFPATRQLKQRMDEVVRAIRWQRIAPPYAAGIGYVGTDKKILTDEWLFRKGETFDTDVVGNRARQGAPARVSRNMELPGVSCDGVPPYVVCAKYPGGAAAVGTFERVSLQQQVFQPRADVRWSLGDARGPFGIFGQYSSLTLVHDPALKVGRILAQDLAGDRPVDITDEVRIRPSEIVLPGKLIERIGLSSALPNDHSMPGMVITL